MHEEITFTVIYARVYSAVTFIGLSLHFISKSHVTEKTQLKLTRFFVSVAGTLLI